MNAGSNPEAMLAAVLLSVWGFVVGIAATGVLWWLLG